MTNIIIIHGAYGDPNENWFPWLKTELEKMNCKVFVPKFPTPRGQSLDNWRKAFKPYMQYVDGSSDEKVIVVGHSLGPAFLLDIIENLNVADDKQEKVFSINSAFFIAGFLGELGNPDFDEINKTFTERNFDWSKIRQNCREFNIYHSDNDPYLPLKKAKQLVIRLGCSVKIVKNAGHFNSASGYGKFEMLLEDIKKRI